MNDRSLQDLTREWTNLGMIVAVMLVVALGLSQAEVVNLGSSILIGLAGIGLLLLKLGEMLLILIGEMRRRRDDGHPTP